MAASALCKVGHDAFLRFAVMSAVFVRSYSNLASRRRCTLMLFSHGKEKPRQETGGLFFFFFLKKRVHPGGFKKNHNMCLMGRISLLTGFDTMDFLEAAAGV